MLLLGLSPTDGIRALWIVMGLVGLAFTYYNYRDSSKDLRAIELMNGKNIRLADEMRIIALAAVRAEIIRMVKCLVIVATGVLGILAPASSARITGVQVVVTFGLFTITGLIVLQSILDTQVRRSLQSMAMRRYDHS